MHIKLICSSLLYIGYTDGYKRLPMKDAIYLFYGSASTHYMSGNPMPTLSLKLNLTLILILTLTLTLTLLTVAVRANPRMCAKPNFTGETKTFLRSLGAVLCVSFKTCVFELPTYIHGIMCIIYSLDHNK